MEKQLDFLTPADKDYWENFYEEGPGKQLYEWYSHITDEMIRKFLFGNESKDRNLIKEGSKCLQVGMLEDFLGDSSDFFDCLLGVGNSVLFENLSEDSSFPANVKLINIDISETAIEYMKERQSKLNKQKIQKINKKIIDINQNESAFKIEYQVMDATNTTFEDKSFDFVLDKGCMDAVGNAQW